MGARQKRTSSTLEEFGVRRGLTLPCYAGRCPSIDSLVAMDVLPAGWGEIQQLLMDILHGKLTSDAEI